MFRALLYMILLMIAISVIRNVIAILAKSFNQGSLGGSRPQGPSTPGEIKGELKKDPVCGTFISTQTEFQKSVGGQRYYFCSKACLDRFKT